MDPVVSDAFDYLGAQSFASLLALFWFVALFEIPRYGLAFLAAALFRRSADSPPCEADIGRVSVVIAGHNEAGAIETCVTALREQSRPPDEIVVVSDGSTDGMAATLADLRRRGLIDKAHATDLRAGKSAATNLAARWSVGDIVVNVDCDCTFDRHAIREIVAPFSDPKVGAVSGDISVRNHGESLVTAFQAIEYLVSITLGKQAADALGQVSCVSGAFGAFRRSAYEAAGGLDAGGGEDLDLTLRLRREGWDIRFAPDAICHTDAPATLSALIRQRFRWERDAVRLRYRKHGELLNPFSPRFSLPELAHELEHLLFGVVAAAALPVYLLWLFATYGAFAITVLAAAQIVLTLLDLIALLLAGAAAPRAHVRRLLPYVIGFSAFNGVFMRFIRLAAYVQEWVFLRSYADAYVPDKVHAERA